MSFSTVPQNHRLVVQCISVVVPENLSTDPSFNDVAIRLYGDKSRTAVTAIRASSSALTGIAELVFNNQIMHFFDAGDVPAILISHSIYNTAFGSLFGFLIDCTVSICMPIAN